MPHFDLRLANNRFLSNVFHGNGPNGQPQQMASHQNQAFIRPGPQGPQGPNFGGNRPPFGNRLPPPPQQGGPQGPGPNFLLGQPQQPVYKAMNFPPQRGPQAGFVQNFGQQGPPSSLSIIPDGDSPAEHAAIMHTINDFMNEPPTEVDNGKH